MAEISVEWQKAGYNRHEAIVDDVTWVLRKHKQDGLGWKLYGPTLKNPRILYDTGHVNHAKKLAARMIQSKPVDHDSPVDICHFVREINRIIGIAIRAKSAASIPEQDKSLELDQCWDVLAAIDDNIDIALAVLREFGTTLELPDPVRRQPKTSNIVFKRALTGKKTHLSILVMCPDFNSELMFDDTYWAGVRAVEPTDVDQLIADITTYRDITVATGIALNDLESKLSQLNAVPYREAYWHYWELGF